jgi:hypothetical protein
MFNKLYLSTMLFALNLIMMPSFLAAVASTVVTVTNPVEDSSNPSAVLITATTINWNASDHLEVWDTNRVKSDIKLGNVFAGSTNTIYVLPSGLTYHNGECRNLVWCCAKFAQRELYGCRAMHQLHHSVLRF